MSTIRVTNAFKPILPAYLDAAPPLYRERLRPPPAIPFFRDKRHTIPTRWGLYRNLLRGTYHAPPITPPAHEPTPDSATPAVDSAEAADETGPDQPDRKYRGLPHLRVNIREQWHRYRGNPSLVNARQFLSTQYDLLALLSSPMPSLEALHQLELHLAVKHYNAHARAAREAAKPVRGPRLSGGYIYPTYVNPPLPRLKPQPLRISMMIKNRVRVRELRIAKSRKLRDWAADMEAEAAFDRGLGVERDKQRGEPGWTVEIRNQLKELDASFELENRRARMTFTKETVEKVEAASKKKWAWMREKGFVRSKGKGAAVGKGESDAAEAPSPAGAKIQP